MASLTNFELNAIYGMMKDLVPGDRYPGKPFLEYIRTLKPGNNAVMLCRDRRTNELVVAKMWMQQRDEAGEPYDVAFLRDKMPRHRSVLKTKGVLTNLPHELCWTVLLPYCNADCVYALFNFCIKEAKLMPEAFLWHLMGSVLGALQACVDEGFCHGDLHFGNVFLHFPEPISTQWPQILLADFDNEFHGDLEFHLRADLRYFFSSICSVVRSLQAQGEYSTELVSLSMLIAGQLGHYDAPSFEAIMKVVRPQIGKCMKLCGGAKHLGGWMKKYLMDLQANAEKQPLNLEQMPHPAPTDNARQRPIPIWTNSAASSQTLVDDFDRMNMEGDLVSKGKLSEPLPQLTAQLIAMTQGKPYQSRLTVDDRQKHHFGKSPASTVSSGTTAFSTW